MTDAHYVEIEATGTWPARTYRYYGRGVWQMLHGDRWVTINAIYVPARVLETAAAQCEVAPGVCG